MSRLLPFLCLLALIQPAFPWGAQGHQAVGEVARGLLTPEAKASITAILGNDDLGGISTWLDDVRILAHHHTGRLKYDDEAKAFNLRHPKNDQWHYVNLPVGYPSGLSGNEVVVKFPPRTEQGWPAVEYH